MRNLLLTATAILAAPLSFAADRATLTGRVTDELGRPLKDSTVMIYQAGVKKGYSIYCPSCYVDCGKRTVTDRTGSFTIPNVDPDLWFELLVIREGYTATFVKQVDPSKGPAETAALKPRAPVEDPGRVVRGRVVDPQGQPQRAAVVLPLGVDTMVNGSSTSTYGTIEGLEPVAVSDSNGEFELAYNQKASGVLLRIEARGMATKLIAVPTGLKRTAITVSDGAVIRGRVIHRGKPVAGVQIGMIARGRGGFGGNLKIIGNPYDEIRIGTQEDGTFVITNVPASVDWYVYGKMDSIGALGATDPVVASTARDGTETDVGDIQIHPGHRLRGRIALADGAQMPDGMHVTVGATRAWDSQTVSIGRDGHFEIAGLPSGKYEVFTSVRGYQLPENRRVIELAIDRDIEDFSILLDPAPRR